MSSRFTLTRQANLKNAQNMLVTYQRRLETLQGLREEAAKKKQDLDLARQGTFLPAQEEELQVLLDALILEKAVYELGYELNNRPDWVKLPLRGIHQRGGHGHDQGHQGSRATLTSGPSG